MQTESLNAAASVALPPERRGGRSESERYEIIMTSSPPRSRKGASKNNNVGAGRSSVAAVVVAPLAIDATKKSTSIIPPRRRIIQPAQLLPLLLMVAFCCFSALAFLRTMLPSQHHHSNSSGSLVTTTLLPLNNKLRREESTLLPLRLLQQEHNQQQEQHELNNNSTSRNTINNNKQVVVASQNNNNNHYHFSPSRSAFTVDILSVASIQQLDLLQAQRETFATHISVRNFFNVTENDDADPDCHKDLTWEDVQQVSSFCRNRPLPSGTNPLLRHLRGKYARIQWLHQKNNPVGWMCAQVRPYSGLMKAYHHYRDNNNNSEEGLPDYFIMLDDDTYYDMEEFEKNFGERNSSEELFYAGCLVRDPVHQINFTFPFGGFGSIFSKGTLRNLFAPIHCPESSSSSLFSSSSMLANVEESTSPIRRLYHQHQPALCDRIAENIVGEKPLFKTGMNLVELMYHYVNAHKYRDVKDWKYNNSTGGGGFCMHSDWVIGYFVNYYNVSRHVMEPYYANVPHARIESYKNSEIYRRGTGFCRNEGINNCEEGSEICHKVKTQLMKHETDRLRSKVPEKFVSSG